MNRIHLVALTLALPLTASAQNTTHRIAYQGRLQLDANAELSGNFHFRFTLYDAQTAGNVLWTDTFNDVPVTLGHFSVLLGDGATVLSDAVWQNDLVYLGIDVMHEADADFTALAGRQRIAAIPVAARSETAKNYHVTGDLVVDGVATLDGGAVIDPSLTVNGNATVSGTTTTDVAHVNTEIRASRIEIKDQVGVLRITDNDPTDIIRITEASPNNIVKVDDSARFVIPTKPTGTSLPSSGNATPEIYSLNAGTEGCAVESDRGSMFVGRPSAQSTQDSLCVCLNLDNVYKWWCFNP